MLCQRRGSTFLLLPKEERGGHQTLHFKYDLYICEFDGIYRQKVQQD